MKTNKKGISLIVLVITIIVIIILAAAVILTINNNNPMDNANKAKYSSDRATMQQAFTTTVGTVMGEELTSPKFLPAAGQAELGTKYKEITANTVYFSAGNVAGTIVFDTTTTGANNYAVGYKLPTYGTGAGSARWFINGAGDLRLVVNKMAYDGSNAGVSVDAAPVSGTFVDVITW